MHSYQFYNNLNLDILNTASHENIHFNYIVHTKNLSLFTALMTMPNSSVESSEYWVLNIESWGIDAAKLSKTIKLLHLKKKIAEVKKIDEIFHWKYRNLEKFFENFKEAFSGAFQTSKTTTATRTFYAVTKTPMNNRGIKTIKWFYYERKFPP